MPEKKRLGIVNKYGMTETGQRAALGWLESTIDSIRRGDACLASFRVEFLESSDPDQCRCRVKIEVSHRKIETRTDEGMADAAIAEPLEVSGDGEGQERGA